MTEMTMLPPPVLVTATQERGHGAEEWAAMLSSKLIAISDSAPEPIRTQAMAYKDRMHAVILWHIAEAMKSDRLTVAGALRRAGHGDIADTIWGI